MPTNKSLLWYPPAPAEAPRGFAQFHPDDWLVQPKLDGIRVIWQGGEPWTRHGQLLSESKGAPQLREMLRGVSDTLDGEWITRLPGYYVFDLPDHPGTLDERIAAVARLPYVPGMWELEFYGGKFAELATRFRIARHEGYVLKRRSSRYEKMTRAGVVTSNWRKRRFAWD